MNSALSVQETICYLVVQLPKALVLSKNGELSSETLDPKGTTLKEGLQLEDSTLCEDRVKPLELPAALDPHRDSQGQHPADFVHFCHSCQTWTASLTGGT